MTARIACQWVGSNQFTTQSLRSKSGSLAIFTAMRLASSFVSRASAEGGRVRSRSLTRPEQHRAADDDRICYHPKQHYDRKLAPVHLLLAMHHLRPLIAVPGHSRIIHVGPSASRTMKQFGVSSAD